MKLKYLLPLFCFAGFSSQAFDNQVVTQSTNSNSLFLFVTFDTIKGYDVSFYSYGECIPNSEEYRSIDIGYRTYPIINTCSSAGTSISTSFRYSHDGEEVIQGLLDEEYLGIGSTTYNLSKMKRWYNQLPDKYKLATWDNENPYTTAELDSSEPTVIYKDRVIYRDSEVALDSSEPTVIYKDRVIYRDSEVALSLLILLASALAFFFRCERNKALGTINSDKEKHDTFVNELTRKLTASEDLRKNQKPDDKIAQANDTIRRANERINQLKNEISDFSQRLVLVQDRAQTAESREIIANKRISELEQRLVAAQNKVGEYTQAEVNVLLASQEAALKRKYANTGDEPINFELGYYAIFGLKPDGLIAAEVKARYKQLSVIYHPDKCGSTEMMQRINIAHNKLKKWHS